MTALFPLVPNWKTPVTERLEFKTDITASRDSTEQRRALRDQPRVTIGFEALADGPRRQVFEQFMQTELGETVALPDYFTEIKTTSVLQNGSDTVTAAAIPSWLTVGTTVVIQARRTLAAMEVEAISGLNVTFTANSAQVWPAGARLRPVIEGELSATQTNALTDQIADVPLNFDVTEGTYYQTTGEPDYTIDGYEIFAQRPDWTNEPVVTYDRKTDVVDYGMGRSKYYLPVPHSNRVFQATYWERTRAQVAWTKQFFLRQKGMRGQFYVPSWTSDMELVRAVAGEESITVKGRDIFDAYASSGMHQALWIRLRSGQNVAVRLGGFDLADGNTVFHVETLAETILPSAVKHVCWLYPARFASDSLTLEWITDSVGQMVASIYGLPIETLDGAALWLISTYGLNFTLNVLYNPLELSMQKWPIISAGVPPHW